MRDKLTQQQTEAEHRSSSTSSRSPTYVHDITTVTTSRKHETTSSSTPTPQLSTTSQSVRQGSTKQEDQQIHATDIEKSGAITNSYMVLVPAFSSAMIAMAWASTLPSVAGVDILGESLLFLALQWEFDTGRLGTLGRNECVQGSATSNALRGNKRIERGVSARQSGGCLGQFLGAAEFSTSPVPGFISF